MSATKTPQKPSPKTPSLRLHKLSKRAFVEIEKRRIYLGRYGDPEATEAYHRLIAEWVANGYRLPVSENEITMAEVIAEYLDYAKTYYHDHRTGGPSSTYTEIKVSVDPIKNLYGRVEAVKFGPVALRAIRQQWIDRGLAITTINSYTGNVKQMCKWAASHQLIPISVHTGLQTLTGLRRGRGVGKDPVARLPVPLEHVEATIPHLPRQLQAIVRLLLVTGARPSEILNLKRADIDTNGPVWTAILRHHKTSYKGKERRLYFGPRAQSALRPFLLRPDDAYMFSPQEAERERYQRQAEDAVGRRENQKPNARRTERRVGEKYSPTGLNIAIGRVCEKHSIPKWTPYQIRHLAATTIEATADMETAKAILGHSGLDITQIYVHRDNKTAAAWAASHG